MASSWIVTVEASPRKPQRYQAVYRDENNRQRSAGIFARKADAKKALAEVSVAMERGAWVDPHGGRTLVSAYAEQWLSERQVADSTRAKLRRQIAGHIVPRFGHLRLKEIKTPLVRTWVAELVSKGYKPNTIRDVTQVLRSMLNTAVEDGYLPTNPARMKVGDLPKQVASEKMFLTPAELHKLIAAIDPRYRTFVETAAWTGMRYGEITALTWKDVSLTDKRLTVDKAVARGEGGKTYIGPPKNEWSRRTITLDRTTVRLLRRHRLETGAAGLVFAQANGKWIDHMYFMEKVWNPACVKTFAPRVNPLRLPCGSCGAQVGDPCRTKTGKGAEAPHKERYGVPMPTFHDLRHTHISFLLSQGLDPVVVARRVGHANPLLTLTTYGHLRHDHAEAVETVIDGARQEQDGSAYGLLTADPAAMDNGQVAGS